MEGLWFTHFSAGPEYGDGMVVLHDGEILGGDRSHTYTGTYHVDSYDLYARVLVKPYMWDIAEPSHPPQEPVMLTLTGTLKGSSAVVSGHPDNHEEVSVSIELRQAA
jgi:hypothetical protein